MELILKDKKAVIFDMDGVLVESEGLWKRAEFEVFSSLGVSVTEEESLLTRSMTTKEVTRFWFERFSWHGKTLLEAEEMVIHRVMELIRYEDCVIQGVKTFIKQLKAQHYKIGLATNAPQKIIPTVLERTKTTDFFDIVSSADFEEKGKPHPAIYLKTAEKLKVRPEECAVIEDSETGMKAAKNAGMTVIAFTQGNKNVSLEWADHKIDDFSIR
ncbi:HAD-IA family hydrolase [Muricauda sp. HICW]|uniref:HAD-IA family hydrolase n=1 Tax=Flagellimonas chongwuensis TaxID=2697365 RepID=A0A850NFE2_9FLAO|nr:HAD-IA family hydrolase [Allomuricauda chongwuensis]NVN19841.1 HAD-IA family hydrolase [Allomuricauda chongwuensis]